jgi:hypothetical protein
VTVPPPEPPAAGQDEGAGRAASRRARRTTAGRLARLADRVPTGWFATILTVAFLGVTAAFGGLAAVAVPPVPDIEPGETHENAQFSLTVERAVLIDELPGSGTSVDDGQRVLALVVTAENVWTKAVPASGQSGVTASVLVDELDDAPAGSVARFDDATIHPWLQPGLPAQLVLTWPVDADRFADGDELHVDLRDFTLYTGQLITYGQTWEDPVVAARMTVPIRDVGAGATPDPDEGADG